jgi:hypothetical protein
MGFANWTAEEVAAKLSKAGLGQFKAVFVEQDISGGVLEKLTLEDLREMGINRGGQEMIMRWIASLTPTSPDEIPVRAAPSDEVWMSRLDEQYELMEPQYREGTLRRACVFCDRKFGLHRIDQHEASCPSRPKPDVPKASMSPPDPENPTPRYPSQFRENHEALQESIRRAKCSAAEVQPNGRA